MQERSSSSIRPMICLDSLGRRRRRRHGPLMTSGFFSVVALAASGAAFSADASAAAALEASGDLPSRLLEAAMMRAISVSDFDFDVISGRPSVLSEGGEAKRRYELSVMRGIFQGKRRRDMQQKMMARDQMSAGWGSYLRSS